MSKSLHIVRVLGGLGLVGSIPVRSMLVDWRGMRTIAAGGELHVSVESLPAGYAWAMFVLGALMLLLGAWTAWVRRHAADAGEG